MSSPREASVSSAERKVTRAASRVTVACVKSDSSRAMNVNPAAAGSYGQ
jgi:hypothetical protein